MNCKRCSGPVVFQPDVGFRHVGQADHDPVLRETVEEPTTDPLEVPYTEDAVGSWDETPLSPADYWLLIYGAKPKGIPWYAITRHERGENCHCPTCGPACPICTTFGG